MNISVKQEQTHIHREHACGCQGGGLWGRDGGRLGLADASYYTEKRTTEGPTV